MPHLSLCFSIMEYNAYDKIMVSLNFDSYLGKTRARSERHERGSNWSCTSDEGGEHTLTPGLARKRWSGQKLLYNAMIRSYQSKNLTLGSPVGLLGQDSETRDARHFTGESRHLSPGQR
jgi:hypothetical protein